MYPSWKIMMMHTIFKGYVLRWETLVGSEEGNVRPNGRGSNWSVTALNLQTLVQGIYIYISDYHSCWSADQSGRFTQATDDFSSKQMGFNHGERLRIHLKTRPGQPFDSSLWLSRKALNSGSSGRIWLGSGVTRRHRFGGATGSQRVITIELTNGLTKQLATFFWPPPCSMCFWRSAWPRPGQTKGKCQVNCRIWLLKFDRKYHQII